MVACKSSIYRFVISDLCVVVFLGTLNKQLAVCKYNSANELIGVQNGCYNLDPVFEWIRHCIISIFLVFFIAFLPLFLQGMLPAFFFFVAVICTSDVLRQSSLNAERAGLSSD